MKSLNYTLSLLFLFSSIIVSQEDYETIATTGSVQITIEEFHNRFEFMPHLNYSNNYPDTLKKEFLYSLIVEKLWTLEVTQLGFDTLDNVKYSLNTLEKMLVKDELFKQEVESEIMVEVLLLSQ